MVVSSQNSTIVFQLRIDEIIIWKTISELECKKKNPLQYLFPEDEWENI